jgi:hypothetical protein
MLGGPGHYDFGGLPFPRPVPAPHSLFGGPGNDQFQAPAEEARHVEPGAGVTPAVCHWVFVL